MAFDVYNLIQSVEVREYLRKHRRFKPLEQEVIIRNSYYTIEQKLEFMKQLLTESREEASDKEELGLLEERVRMYEFIVSFIHSPGEDPMEVADNAEAFSSGPAIVEVADVVESKVDCKEI